MSAFNVVEGVVATCPQCHQATTVSVQFKFGAVINSRYRIGDVVRWGANENGEPGKRRVVVYGAVGLPCSICGFDGDWDFDVFISNDKIVEVLPSSGVYNFACAGRSYIEI